MPRGFLIQARRDTAANWAATHPTPAAGELCFETDTGILRIGDGATVYTSLPTCNGATVDAELTKVANSNLSSTHKITRSATLVIAANDSSAKSKAQADYVCDGTDDNVEIQAALDALPSHGGTIVVLDGNYSFGAGISISKSNLCLVGNYSVITLANSSSPCSIISVTSATNIQISNFLINGNKSNQSAGLYSGIDISASTNVSVKHCIVHDIRAQADNTHAYAFNVYNGSDYVTYENCKGYNGSHGFVAIWASNVKYLNCDGYNNSHDGFTSHNGEIGANGHTIAYNNCNAWGNNEEGWDLELGLITATLINCNSHENTTGFRVAGLANQDGIIAHNINFNSCNSYSNIEAGFLFDNGVHDISLISCRSYSNGSEGISLNASKFVQLVGCSVYENAQTLAKDEIYVLNSTNTRISNSYIKQKTGSANFCIREYGASSAYNFFVGNQYIPDSYRRVSIVAATSTSISNHAGTGLMQTTGTATITAGNTTVAVTHRLVGTPSRCIVTPTTDTEGKRFWISAKASSTFTITIDSSSAADIVFDWRATYGDDL